MDLLPTSVVICTVKGCDNKHLAKGLCSKHYSRLRNHGDVRISLIDRDHDSVCGVDGCAESYFANGKCRKHNMDGWIQKLKAQPCKIEDCARPMYRRRWCSAHYQRWRQYGDPFGGGPSRRDRGTGLGRRYYELKRRQAKAKRSQFNSQSRDYVDVIINDPCVYCGAPSEEIDHIVPFSLGGSSFWDNLAPTCRPCNARKGTLSALDFMIKRLEVLT